VKLHHRQRSPVPDPLARHPGKATARGVHGPAAQSLPSATRPRSAAAAPSRWRPAPSSAFRATRCRSWLVRWRRGGWWCHPVAAAPAAD